MDDATALLITVTGTDRPGITSGLCHALERTNARILDMEQVVIRDRLLLGLLVSPGGGALHHGGCDPGRCRRHGCTRRVPSVGRTPKSRRGTVVRRRARSAVARGRDQRGGRNHCGMRLQHRPHRSAVALSDHELRVPGVRCRWCRAARTVGRRRCARTDRRRRSACDVVSPGQTADCHGRRLDPGPGRGHRDARGTSGLPHPGRGGDRTRNGGGT